MLRLRHASALAVALVTGAAGVSSARAQLTVDGTEFVLTTADGRMLRSKDLVGATLKIRAGQRDVEIEIRDVADDRDAVGGRVVLHRFVGKDGSGRKADLCTADAQGRKLGFPVPDGEGGFTLTCTSGAVGKCVRWGYRPWEEKPGGPPLRALHRSCVHMARADYGGDDRPSTRDGTLIDIADRFGIRTFNRALPMQYEAAWGVAGAVCVARPRIRDNITLAQVAERYPRLAARLGPESCTEATALGDAEALVFNRSYEAAPGPDRHPTAGTPRDASTAQVVRSATTR